MGPAPVSHDANTTIPAWVTLGVPTRSKSVEETQAKREKTIRDNLSSEFEERLKKERVKIRKQVRDSLEAEIREEVQESIEDSLWADILEVARDPDRKAMFTSTAKKTVKMLRNAVAELHGEDTDDDDDNAAEKRREDGAEDGAEGNNETGGNDELFNNDEEGAMNIEERESVRKPEEEEQERDTEMREDERSVESTPVPVNNDEAAAHHSGDPMDVDSQVPPESDAQEGPSKVPKRTRSDSQVSTKLLPSPDNKKKQRQGRSTPTSPTSTAVRNPSLSQLNIGALNLNASQPVGPAPSTASVVPSSQPAQETQMSSPMSSPPNSPTDQVHASVAHASSSNTGESLRRSTKLTGAESASQSFYAYVSTHHMC